MKIEKAEGTLLWEKGTYHSFLESDFQYGLPIIMGASPDFERQLITPAYMGRLCCEVEDCPRRHLFTIVSPDRHIYEVCSEHIWKYLEIIQ